MSGNSNSTEPRSPIDTLPVEVLRQVISHLPAEEVLMNLRLSSSKLNQIVLGDRSLEERLVQRLVETTSLSHPLEEIWRGKTLDQVLSPSEKAEAERVPDGMVVGFLFRKLNDPKSSDSMDRSTVESIYKLLCQSICSEGFLKSTAPAVVPIGIREQSLINRFTERDGLRRERQECAFAEAFASLEIFQITPEEIAEATMELRIKIPSTASGELQKGQNIGFPELQRRESNGFEFWKLLVNALKQEEKTFNRLLPSVVSSTKFLSRSDREKADRWLETMQSTDLQKESDEEQHHSEESQVGIGFQNLSERDQGLQRKVDQLWTNMMERREKLSVQILESFRKTETKVGVKSHVH